MAQSKASTIEEYLSELAPDRQEAMSKLIEVIRKNIPSGFTEGMGYGMPAWVVPHTMYPGGYHCDPKLPLPFLNVASQKNYISIYHMGIYGGPLMDWVVEKWKTVSPKKPDFGKGCMRFKKVEDIPYEFIGELVSKITPLDWIALYEKNLKRS
jgi:hypothetical protein